MKDMKGVESVEYSGKIFIGLLLALFFIAVILILMPKILQAFGVVK